MPILLWHEEMSKQTPKASPNCFHKIGGLVRLNLRQIDPHRKGTPLLE